MHRSRCALFVFLLLAGVAAHAQKTEVSLTLGAAVSPDGKGPVTCGEAIICPISQGTIGSVSIGPGISWQASLAYRLANFRAAALYVELPFAGSPSRTGPGFSPDFSTFFFTPSAHLKFLPGTECRLLPASEGEWRTSALLIRLEMQACCSLVEE